jgi:nitroreductase
MTQTHPLLALYASHRTIRNYKPQPLAAGDLERLIEAGRRAPSGAAGQIFSVIRVVEADRRERLAALCGNQQHIRAAAEFFVFCVDVYRMQRLLERQGDSYGTGPRVAVQYGTMDALLVAANMATAAEALGYGACFIGAVLNYLDALARELELPQGVIPVVGLTVGVPAEGRAPPTKPRLPRQLVFHDNTYREPTAEDLDAACQVMGEAWCQGLDRYFGPAGRLYRREAVWLRTLAQQGFETIEGERADD